MTKQIPESKIALNPVVIDDSKRGLPPQNNIPPDMDALLAWLKDRELYAHNKDCAQCCENVLPSKVRCGCKYSGMEKAYNRVIAWIENSRVNQRIHISEKV